MPGEVHIVKGDATGRVDKSMISTKGDETGRVCPSRHPSLCFTAPLISLPDPLPHCHHRLIHPPTPPPLPGPPVVATSRLWRLSSNICFPSPLIRHLAECHNALPHLYAPTASAPLPLLASSEDHLPSLFAVRGCPRVPHHRCAPGTAMVFTWWRQGRRRDCPRPSDGGHPGGGNDNH